MGGDAVGCHLGGPAHQDAVARPDTRGNPVSPFEASRRVWGSQRRTSRLGVGSNERGRQLEVALLPFSLRDKHRDDDQREGDNHPVLKRDTQKREPLSQPAVQSGPRKLLKSYSRERA
jgi:hypothetical protein